MQLKQQVVLPAASSKLRVVQSASWRIHELSTYPVITITLHDQRHSQLAATLRGSRPGGAIRIAHYDVIDDVITRKV